MPTPERIEKVVPGQALAAGDRVVISPISSGG
jgi:hypothetical protein